MSFKAIKAAHYNHKQSNFFVTVSKDSDKGYWEIDYVNQIANFRHFSNQKLPKGIDISDHTDKYDTIVDFFKDTLFSYTKEIIKDKKIIFSNKVFCDVSYCDKQAKIKILGDKRYCNKHKPFTLL